MRLLMQCRGRESNLRGANNVLTIIIGNLVTAKRHVEKRTGSPTSLSSVRLRLFHPWPSFEEIGNFNTKGSGWQCAHARLARGELSHVGRHDRRLAHRLWRKP